MSRSHEEHDRPRRPRVHPDDVSVLDERLAAWQKRLRHSTVGAMGAMDADLGVESIARIRDLEEEEAASASLAKSNADTIKDLCQELDRRDARLRAAAGRETDLEYFRAKDPKAGGWYGGHALDRIAGHIKALEEALK